MKTTIPHIAIYHREKPKSIIIAKEPSRIHPFLQDKPYSIINTSQRLDEEIGHLFEENESFPLKNLNKISKKTQYINGDLHLVTINYGPGSQLPIMKAAYLTDLDETIIEKNNQLFYKGEQIRNNTLNTILNSYVPLKRILETYGDNMHIEPKVKITNLGFFYEIPKELVEVKDGFFPNIAYKTDFFKAQPIKKKRDAVLERMGKRSA